MYPKHMRASHGLNGAYSASSPSSHCWLFSDIRWAPPAYFPWVFSEYPRPATVILAVTAIITGLVRLILQDKSPWKVRSVAFDSFIGIALGIGLLITYFSFFGLFGNIFFR